jgi:hypothetical protein
MHDFKKEATLDQILIFGKLQRKFRELEINESSSKDISSIRLNSNGINTIL